MTLVKSWLFTLCLVIGTCGLAGADQLLIQTSQNSTKSTAYNTPFTLVTVGSSDVTISKFGVYGEALSAINLEYLIFDVLNPAVNTTPPIYNSGPVSAPLASSYQWYDNAISGNFVLQAGHTYGMGVIADTANGFSYGTNFNAFGGAAITQNGLTIPFKEPLTAPGSFLGGSGAPSLYATNVSSTQFRTALEIFAPFPPAPIPASLFLLGSGLLGMVGWRRTKRS